MNRTANDGNVILSGVPEIPAEISELLRPYQNTRFATFADFTADGEGIYISTRFASVAQLHRVDAPAGMRRQLTFSPEPIRDAKRRPGSEELLFERDTGGGEFFQLFIFDPSTARTRMLTDGTSRNTDALLFRDGSHVVYTSTARDGRSNDVWLMDPDDPGSARTVILAEDGQAWAAADWHEGTNQLLIEEYVSITDTRAHIVDLGSGERRKIAGGDGPEGVFSPVCFDRSGKGVFIVTDREGEFSQLARLDLETGEIRTITGAIPWNVEGAALDQERERMVFSTNENGSSRVYILNMASLEFQPVRELPLGVIYSFRFSPNGSRIGFTMDPAVSPADAYTLDLGSDRMSTGNLQRWTFSEVGGLDEARFVAPKTISFTSFDGLSVPAFLYEPAGAGPHPVIIHIHGGPEGQSRPLFAGAFQSWINELGAAVIDPNVRGSAGYGKSYLKLDNGMLREDSVRDIGALLDWIARQSQLDEKRVLVYGGSYGGYMVLASLMHYSDRLRAGVDIVGISDFITFLENTQDYRRDLRRVEYGDERDPEMRAFFERVSPLRNAHRIHAPLFVIQGQNDPRVPASEAEQIVAEVRATGRPVWFMNALNEGHGYARKENQDLMRDAVFLFMRDFLLG